MKPATTTPFSAASSLDVLRQACAAANLDVADATLMRLGENALYLLASGPVVVRIARTMDYWADVQCEVDVARWLASVDFPAARVADAGIAQPLATAGHPVTFWQFIDGRVAEPSDIALLGSVLRRFHALSKPVDFTLPRFDVLGRVEARIEQSQVSTRDKDFLLERCHRLAAAVAALSFELPPTVVHGDAHIKNIMVARTGPVLIDFERVGWGQPEWDLAMTATEYLTAGWWTDEQYAEFVAAYGFDVTTWSGFTTLRQTHEIKMTTWLMQNVHESQEIADEYKARMRTIRTGDNSESWQPF